MLEVINTNITEENSLVKHIFTIQLNLLEKNFRINMHFQSKISSEYHTRNNTT